MGARQELLEGMKAQIKPVYYKFPKEKGKLFKKKRSFKFLIRPLVAEDFINDKITQDALKEVSTGQTYEEASRVVAQKFKENLMKLDAEAIGKMILSKGVVFPKIIFTRQSVTNDEIPFEMLTDEMKVFLAKKLQEISPIFQGA